MSAAALALVLGYWAMYGATRQEDEGTAAHLYQLLMGGQLPIVGYFIVSTLPSGGRPAAWIVVAQIAAAMVAFAALYLLEHAA